MGTVTLILNSGSRVELHPPTVPPTPKIGRVRRRELSGLWLQALGLPDTLERVEELAPFVARFPQGTALRGVADGLVRCGQLPTREAVEAGYVQVQAGAAEWLESLSQTPTPQRINDLAPYVGRFTRGSRLGMIADQIVGQNQLPTWPNIRKIERERSARRDRRSERLARQVSEARALEPRLDPLILAEIDRHWAEHGHGPTWSRLGRLFGLNRWGVGAVIRELADRRLVYFTEEAGSLQRIDPEL